MRLKTILFVLTALLTFSCSEKMEKVPVDKFIGTWETNGSGLTEGIQIKIQMEDNKLVGRVYKLNDNKYVRLFVDSNEVIVPSIDRKSNYEFKLTENKVGKDLFATYGQKTSQDFKVQFIDNNTIGLAGENSDPLKSTRVYKRIQ